MDHAAVVRHVDRDVPVEHLQAAEVLVEVYVRDAAVRAPVPAGDRQVRDVGGGDAELRRAVADVIERDVQRV